MTHSAKAAFHVGEHVSWNSEAGRVRGVIKKKLTAATKLKGYIVRASKEEPQYVIESDKTDHVAETRRSKAVPAVNPPGPAVPATGPSRQR